MRRTIRCSRTRRNRRSARRQVNRCRVADRPKLRQRIGTKHPRHPPRTTARHHEGCRTATLGCVDSKRALSQSLIDYLAPIRARSLELRGHPKMLDDILHEGARTARAAAQETLRTVRDRLGLYP